MRKMKKEMVILMAALMLTGCSENRAETETEVQYVGTLGEDVSLSEMDDYIGKEMDATLIYELETNYDHYPYLFCFLEKTEDGSMSGNFRVKDGTEGNVLSGLHEYDMEDHLAVKVRLILDDVVYYEDSHENLNIEYEVNVKEAEFLELNSVESKLAASGYFIAGNTINYKGGLSIYIAETGTCYVDNKDCAYVKVEAVNNGEETAQLPYADFYGDDYALDIYFLPESNVNGASLAPGRKTQGTYYAELKGNHYDTIEAELYNAIVMVQYPAEESDSSSIYGRYTCDNGINAVIEGDVGIYTDTDESYLYLAALYYDSNHYNPEFSGILKPVSEHVYHVTDELSGLAELEVVFSDGGMQVTVLRADSEEYQVLEGYYEMTSALDFSQVG